MYRGRCVNAVIYRCKGQNLYYRWFNFIMEEKMSDCIDKLQNEIDELKKDHKKLMSGSERGSSSSSSSSSSGSERKESRSGSKKSSSKK